MKGRIEKRFDGTVESTIRALEEDGVGHVCTVKPPERLDEERRRYPVLGAYNPKFAHHGLTKELDIVVPVVSPRYGLTSLARLAAQRGRGQQRV